MSERFVPLRISCPVVGCQNQNIYNWVHTTNRCCMEISNRAHTGCSTGSMEISNRARIKCTGCSNVDQMMNWRFSCPNHAGNYQSTDHQSFVNSLSVALRIGDYNDVMTELVKYLMDNRWN
nr:636_t:CDS:1 [Entrophospora candida]CAG8633252.1 4655_t:CDS:1 [Entrophospora candida]